jgi:hypothetical protein
VSLKWSNVRHNVEVSTTAEASIDKRDAPPSPDSPKLSSRTTVLAWLASAGEKRNVVMPTCGVSSQRVKCANAGAIRIVNLSLLDLQRKK